jgi:hypothetical protein
MINKRKLAHFFSLFGMFVFRSFLSLPAAYSYRDTLFTDHVFHRQAMHLTFIFATFACFYLIDGISFWEVDAFCSHFHSRSSSKQGKT